MSFTPESSGPRDGIERLTPRERECLRLVSQHLSSKEIARQLGISQHTVDGHLDEARRKLGSPTRRDAARTLLENETQIPPPKSSGGQSAPLSGPPVQGAPSGWGAPIPGGQPSPVVNPSLQASSGVAGDAVHVRSELNPPISPTSTPPRESERSGRASWSVGSVARYELTPFQRLAAIVIIAVASALLLTLLLFGAHQFTFLLQRMTED